MVKATIKREAPVPKRLLTVPSGTLLLLVLTAACSHANSRERAFSRLLQSDDVNSSILLSPVAAERTPSVGAFVAAQIENRAEEEVVFPPGYGARGFIWLDADGVWEEISNEVDYPDVGFELGPAGGSTPFISTVNFASTDPRIGETVAIRILVEGSLRPHGEAENVSIAAFVDVALTR
jgi:hypothetical protein